MSYLTHLECFRCGRTYPPGRQFLGCPACTGAYVSNLFCVYDYAAIGRTWNTARLAGRPSTLWRYHEFLPVDVDNAVTLGEGMTPLLEVPRLGRRLGLNHLYIKDESQNPTWSFKDRMGAVGATEPSNWAFRC